MSAKPKFVFHSQVSLTLERWAEDLTSMANSVNLARQIVVNVEMLWLRAWAETAKAKAFGSTENPDHAGYAELAEHCNWRFENLHRFRNSRATDQALLAEVEMVMSWIISCVGGNDA